jgi:hypothetical protein
VNWRTSFFARAEQTPVRTTRRSNGKTRLRRAESRCWTFMGYSFHLRSDFPAKAFATDLGRPPETPLFFLLSIPSSLGANSTGISAL